MNLQGLRAAAQDSPIRLNVAGAQDARGPGVAPASLLIETGEGGDRLRLMAIGTPGEIDRDARSGRARVVEMPRTVILPGMVNAHTHLDLTHIGPREHDAGAGFMPWVEMIRAVRAADEAETVASVARGIELSRSAGVVAVGDIAGAPRSTPGRASLAAWRTMREKGMAGVSFLEFFAIGAGREQYLQWLPRILEEAEQEGALAVNAGSGHGARIGLQPHAPNTVCLDAYRWARSEAKRRSLPLSTHLAESPEERRFIGEGTGPMRELLERLGLWDDSILAETGGGLSPVAHLAPVLAGSGAIVAHVNNASDADVELLARSGCTVAYCPRASEYFGAVERFGPHRYRDMIAAGINVALGTDSIVNLPVLPPTAARTPAEGGSGMSILDEMRLLWRRDGTDARTLLAMGTTNGAQALGLADGFVLEAGSVLAGLVGVEIEPGGESEGGEPIERVFDSASPAELLFG